MGVGKTTTCQLLKKQLANAIFLDGDWCWDASPFIVNDETKAMVQENICFLLNQFLASTTYENIIFCWVMHEQEIIDNILYHLNTASCTVHTISLICSEDALRRRLTKDVENGIRKPESISRSLARLEMYTQLNTRKIDVSNLSPKEAAEQIAAICDEK